MVNRAHKGRRLEWKSKALLESLGYEVIRAAGSKGVWDLWAVNGAMLLLVQVKANRNASPAERRTLRRFPCPPMTRRVIHVWPDGARLPVVHDLTDGPGSR